MEGLGLGAVRVSHWGGGDGAGHRSLGGSVHSGLAVGASRPVQFLVEGDGIQSPFRRLGLQQKDAGGRPWWPRRVCVVLGQWVEITNWAVGPVGLGSSLAANSDSQSGFPEISCHKHLTFQHGSLLNPFSVLFFSLLFFLFPLPVVHSSCQHCLPPIFPSFFHFLLFPLPSNSFVICFFLSSPYSNISF